MEAAGRDLESRLGPTAFAPVKVNGVTTDALIDTGSPATIISLEFILKVLAGERARDQTAQQWQEATRRKFASPDVALNNYGGQRLDIMAQIELSLTQGGRCVDAVVLIQKDAPNNLLLGTDVQPRLGFCLVMKNADGEMVDLLRCREENLTGAAGLKPGELTTSPSDVVPNVTEEMQPTEAGEEIHSPREGEVRLLQAVKIPAGYQKLVRGSVDRSVEAGSLLFTPHAVEEPLRMADSAVEVKEDRVVTLVVQNHGTDSVRLKEGIWLGTVTPIDLVTAGGDGTTIGESSAAPECSEDTETAVRRLECDYDSQEARITQLFAQLDMKTGHLTPVEQQQLETLLASYADVFALESSELGTTGVVTHSIETGEQRPIRQQVRRTPFALRAKVDTLIQEMLEQDVIEPSGSPWASPIVLVRKKDGGVRFCVDYRKLNQVTKLDEFPLPRIDDTLDLLAGSQYFTTLDLASGYWQVQMEPSSREKTAFTTYSGLYQFKKMPFGLVNAPATFQRLMEVVLSNLARRTCLVYLDDILVIGKTKNTTGTSPK